MCFDPDAGLWPSGRLCAETGVGPDAISWEGGGVCFDPDAGLWPSGRLSSAPMCRQSFP